MGIALSAAEYAQLQTWIAESPENSLLFSELTDEGARLPNLNIFSKVDVDTEWSNLKDQLSTTKSHKPFGFRKLLPYAAAISVGLLLYMVNYYYSNPKSAKPVVAVAKDVHDVQAATQGATLTLADGRTIRLDQKTAISEENGLFLNASGSELKIASDPATEADPTAINIMTVPKGAYYTVILADDTKVWVNANSKLTFPTNFSTGQRRVKLEGEAFFEVNHDPQHPFIVEANGTETQVLGTRFNVNAYSEKVKTTLEQGKVAFAAHHQKATLLPGQYAAWTGESMHVATANLGKELAWKNKEFRFENDDMIHIAYELSRWYDVQVKFAGDIDLKKQYSGSMSRELSLAQVLNVLQFGSDFDFEIHDKQLLIKNK